VILGSRAKAVVAASQQPLWRLLAINLASGIAVAILLVGGLLALNPAHLRDLIVTDIHGVATIALLLFGFVITLGSTAMGTAIMAIGRSVDRARADR
jgi:hypothetical protein